MDEPTSRLARPRRFLADSIEHVIAIARRDRLARRRHRAAFPGRGALRGADGARARPSGGRGRGRAARRPAARRRQVRDTRAIVAKPRAAERHRMARDALPPVDRRRRCWRTPGSTRSASGSTATTSARTAAGYPRGLAGDEIPLEARILAVADAYEAMTNDRVYRRSIGQLARARGAARATPADQFDERRRRGVPAGSRADGRLSGLASQRPDSDERLAVASYRTARRAARP